MFSFKDYNPKLVATNFSTSDSAFLEKHVLTLKFGCEIKATYEAFLMHMNLFSVFAYFVNIICWMFLIFMLCDQLKGTLVCPCRRKKCKKNCTANVKFFINQVCWNIKKMCLVEVVFKAHVLFTWHCTLRFSASEIGDWYNTWLSF